MQGLSLRCGTYQRQQLRQRLCLRQRQALTLAQKCELRLDQIYDSDGLFGLFLGIISHAHGQAMQPNALCIKCQHTLSITEIVIGFKTDVNDFTTQCPRCKQRFEPTNLVDQRTGKEHGFWCRDQTLDRLPGMEVLKVEEFREQHPEVYFSAIFHFGSLFNAFKRKGLEYRKEEWDWETKVKFCLGQISDKDISEIKGKGSIIPANRRISLAV